MSYVAKRWERVLDIAIVVVFLMLLLGIGYLFLPDPVVFARDGKMIAAFVLVLVFYTVAVIVAAHNRTIYKYQRQLRRSR